MYLFYIYSISGFKTILLDPDLYMENYVRTLPFPNHIKTDSLAKCLAWSLTEVVHNYRARNLAKCYHLNGL